MMINSYLFLNLKPVILFHYHRLPDFKASFENAFLYTPNSKSVTTNLDKKIDLTIANHIHVFIVILMSAQDLLCYTYPSFQ